MSSHNDDSTGQLVKTFGGPGNELSKAVRSQQDVPENYSGLEYYKPPYNPDHLVRLLDRHEAHDVAVRKKAQYVAGFGLGVVAAEQGDAEPGEPPEALTQFWESGAHQLGPDRQPATASEVLRSGWHDFESVGWCALEILVNGEGMPVGLAHVPAHTVRKAKDSPAYIQLDAATGQPDVYFGVAGNRYGDDKTFINKDTGEEGATGDQIANELLVIRNYSPASPHYGTPDIISAIETLEADVDAREYNARFFENDGVPRFAVIVEGGELTDRAWNRLEEQFRDLRASENSHRGVLLEANNLAEAMGEQHNVSIRIEPLTVGVDEDASFTDFRKANRHDILRAHEVPPVVAGDMPDANRSITEELRQIFAEEVIAPKQSMLAARLYQLLHVTAFDEPEWAVELTLKGADARMQEAKIADTRMNAAGQAFTINEARAEVDLPKLDGPEGNLLVAEVTGGQGGTSTTPPAAGGEGGGGEKGYSITKRARKNAQFSEADPVDVGGKRGVVLEVHTAGFEFGGTDYDASSESPKYVVASEDAGAQVVAEADLQPSEWDEEVDADPADVNDAEAKYHLTDDDAEAIPATKDLGFNEWPDSWRESPTPNRVILLKAWVAMGASWRGCFREIKSKRICSAMKDEVYLTTEWR